MRQDPTEEDLARWKEQAEETKARYLADHRLAERVRELMGADGLSRLGIRDQWSVGNFRVVHSPADLFPEKET
jgi:hypothetical protein